MKYCKFSQTTCCSYTLNIELCCDIHISFTTHASLQGSTSSEHAQFWMKWSESLPHVISIHPRQTPDLLQVLLHCITTILNLNIHRLSFCRTICLNLESTIVVGNFLMTWELDAASVEAALGRWRKIRCRCLQDSFEESCIWNWCKRCKWSDPVSLLFVRSKNAHGWSFLYLFARYPKWILFETNGMNDENFGPGTERQLSCTDVIRKFDSPMDHEFRNIIKYNHSVIYCIILLSKYVQIKLSSGISWNTMRSRFDTFSHQKLLDWWLLVGSQGRPSKRLSKRVMSFSMEEDTTTVPRCNLQCRMQNWLVEHEFEIDGTRKSEMNNGFFCAFSGMLWLCF